MVGLGFLSPKADAGYSTWILVGLVLSLIGDIFNIDMKNDTILLVAIAIFVVAYLEYGITFTVFSGFHWQDLIVAAVFLPIYILLMRYLWVGLGNFKTPVLIYGLVMPFMVTRAISTFFGTTFSPISALFVTLGTVMFYLADIEYGIHRFRKPIKFFVGPMFYTLGQLLVALSCSYFLR